MKNISNKVFLLSVLCIALCGRSAAHDVCEFHNAFTAMGTAERDAAIYDLSVRHFRRPSNPYFIQQQAEAYTAKNQTDSALFYWHLLSALQPGNDTALFTQAQLYYCINSPDSAVLLVRQALALQPDRIAYLELQAMADYRLGLVDSAFALCERILTRTPSDVSALLLSGMVLRDRHKNAEALACFIRCLKVDPANTEALIYRADEYVLLKKYNDALRDYSAARADLSTSADILNNIGICYYQSGDYKRAIGLFRRAIAIDRRHPQSYFNQGISYYHLNELDTASSDVRMASAIWDTSTADTSHANFLDAIYYLGMCYMKTGDLPTARSYFVLLQKEKYPTDLTSDIRLIDHSLFISRNWYYFLILFLLAIGLIVALTRIMRPGQ